MATWLGKIGTPGPEPVEVTDPEEDDEGVFEDPLFVRDVSTRGVHCKRPRVGDSTILASNAPPTPCMQWDQFNEEQMAFIRQPVEASGTLLGVPGGGKTRTILGRIAWLRDHQQIPAQGFLLLTFNRAACADLVRKAQDWMPQIPCYQAIRTVHSVAGSIVLKVKGATPSQDMNTVVLQASRVCDRTPAATLRQVACLKHVRTIIVDEAQDLNATQYAFVQTLGRVLVASVVLVGDPNQSIYQFQGGSDHFLRQHPGFTVALVKNYRSTAPLVQLVEAARPVRHGPMESTSTLQHAPRPRLVSGTADVLREDILTQVAAARVRGHTVALVGPVKRCRPSSDGRLYNIGLQWAAQVLRDVGVPFCLHYQEGVADTDPRRASKRKAENGHDPSVVHLLTVHGSKGLEFDEVLVLNFHYATMGRQPASQESEAELAYLWYVALSRAKTRMTIYRFAHRVAWPGVHRQGLLPLLDVVGPVPDAPPLQTLPASDPLPQHWHVTDLLQNRRVLTEEYLDALVQTLGLQLPAAGSGSGGPMAKAPTWPLYDELSPLFGMWAEETFYHAYRGGTPPCLEIIQVAVLSAIQVSPERAKQFGKFCREYGLTDMAHGVVDLAIVETRRPRGPRPPQFAEMFDWLQTLRQGHAGQPARSHVFVYAPNAVQWFEKDVLRSLCEQWTTKVAEGKPLSVADIWQMSLFLWQREAEAGWRWHQDYTAVYHALADVDARIRTWARNTPDGFTFQSRVDLHHLPLSGITDAVCTGSATPGSASQAPRLLELKFAPHGLTLKHALQAALYAEMWQRREAPQVEVEVWNLCTGERHRVVRKSDPQSRWTMYAALSDVFRRPLTKTLWLYDLETTGLDTETCNVLDIHLEDLTTGIVPVSTLVYQETVPDVIQTLTGIVPADVAQAPRVTDVMTAVRNVLGQCQDPSLFAYNGHRFDHLILRRHLAQVGGWGHVPGHVTWGDPFAMLCAMCPLKTANRKLTTLYEGILGHQYAGRAHRAAADVDMMQQMLQRLHISETVLRLSATVDAFD